MLVIFALFVAATFAGTISAHFRVSFNPSDVNPYGQLQYYNGAGVLTTIGGPSDGTADDVQYFKIDGITNTSIFTYTSFSYDDLGNGDGISFNFYGALTDNELFARVDTPSSRVTYYMRPNVFGFCPDILFPDHLSHDTSVHAPRVTGTPNSGFCEIVYTYSTAPSADNYAYFAATEAPWNDFQWIFGDKSFDTNHPMAVLTTWQTNTIPNQRYSYVVGNATVQALALIPANESICNPPCENNGICQNGACFCSGNYVNATCNTPVENVIYSDTCFPTCKNGGVCLYPATCFCPGGFFGASCNETAMTNAQVRALIDSAIQDQLDSQGDSSVASVSGLFALVGLFIHAIHM